MNVSNPWCVKCLSGQTFDTVLSSNFAAKEVTASNRLIWKYCKWRRFKILFNFFCVDVVPVNTNPAVNASLENKKTNITRFQTVEPVFKCLFDEPTGGPYWYDTYWYINTDTVKVVESQPYQSNQSWLYPEDWVHKYNLNMVVRYLRRNYTDFK